MNLRGDYGVYKNNNNKKGPNRKTESIRQKKKHGRLLEIKVLHIRTCKTQITRRAFPLSSRDSRVYALSAES